MEDMLPETKTTQEATASAVPEALENLLRDHKGVDVLLIDLRNAQAWTDFFIIATASSDAHMDGMERHIREFCSDNGIEILRRSRKPAGMEDEWRIIDLGPAVIHLMSSRARTFYNLERLYSSSYSKSSSSS